MWFMAVGELFEVALDDAVDVGQTGEGTEDLAEAGLMGGTDAEALAFARADSTARSRHELDRRVDGLDFSLAGVGVRNGELVRHRHLARAPDY